MTAPAPQKRKNLPRRHFAYLCLKQDGKCPNCGDKLDLIKERGTIDEHLVPLFSGGTNDLDNRAVWCFDCAKEKTREEAPERARVRRHSEATSNQYTRRKDRGGSSVKGRGFQSNRDGKYKQKIGGRTELRWNK